MKDQEMDIPSSDSKDAAPDISKQTRRFIPSPRQLIRLWPLLILAAINTAVLFASNAPAVYKIAVAVGTLGVAAAVGVSAASETGPLRNIAAKLRKPRMILPAVGVAMQLFLLARVLTEPTNGYDLILWAAGMSAIGAAFVDLSALKNLSLRPPALYAAMQNLSLRPPSLDAAIVISLVVACIALHAHDLRDWYYAAIGDEISFYIWVRKILDEGIRQPFALHGAYHNSPMLNSVYQTFVSWIFGGGAWGWKFSSVVSVAITAAGLYLLGRLFAGRIAGVVSAVIFLASHYVMAFTHTGYAHLDALAVTVWAMLALIVGAKRQSAPILFAAGILAGLSLYTFLPARVVFPLIIAWLLIQRMPIRQWLALWPLGLGFTLCATPFIAENTLDIITVMGIDTIAPNTNYASEIGNPLSRIFDNLSRNLLVWWWNDRVSHYTSGSLLDLLSGVLAIVGIGVAVGKWRRYDKLLIIWLILTLLATAVASPYAYVPLTRLHANLIPLALISGIGVSVCLDWIKGYWTYKYVAVGVILAVIVALNVWRFQVITPEAIHHYTPETVATKAWLSDQCGKDDDTLFIGPHGHLMELVILTYIPEGERPKVVGYDDPLVMSPWPDCKIFFRPDEDEAKRILSLLSDNPTRVSNPTGYTYVQVVKEPSLPEPVPN